MHIGKYFGLSAAFIVGGCATSETMVLKPYRLENGVVLQDVVTVGGNGKGTAPVVTAVKTFELAGNKTRLVHSASGSEGSMGSAVARAVASGVAAGVPAAVAQVIANRADGERITVSNSNSSSPVNTNTNTPTNTNNPTNTNTNNPTNTNTNNPTNTNTNTSMPTNTNTNTNNNDNAPEPDANEASDRRLKRDIARLAELANGLGIYRFRYLWSDEVFVGVMAQEVLEVMPEAVVIGSDGYMRVNYTKLGIEMLSLEQWTSRLVAGVPSSRALRMDHRSLALASR
ncbi:tail fiber domain-containing protein [Sinorhizobium medicae]|uniref:tail fiber domain-containing protein n=1 Tax=Sinorhizobium medicae TaxID=110321 RepID=UPI000FD867F2|nr:tail fiber domain-containing protein [Sinorhizobium medicae]RVK16077.1 tail fiber domain-containing protein [Sinorhizobium medicae]